jgi:peptidoglycan/xylan/chitin deacetylase (PgdA/CDA1 family)
MDKIYVLITMDVEPALSGAARPDGASGPRDYAESDRFIRGYARRAGRYGFPVSYMLHPEVTAHHAPLFLELEADGACLGLHLHPWKFADGHYKAHFGGLSAEQQYAIVSEATAIWYSNMGKRPHYFRPGTFSANDSTFGVLDRLGFLGGSVSIPGRVYPDLTAVWAGAVLDPHRANGSFRQVPGELDFVNIPLSVDVSALEDLGGRKFHWDLRPDWLRADYARITRNILRQVRERAPEVPVIHMVTHNDNDYGDDEDRVCRNFETVLQEIRRACEESGVEPVGATYADIVGLIRGGVQRAPSFVFADSSMLTGQS